MRLDRFLCENKYFESRTKASRAISCGEVLFDGNSSIKPSDEVDENVIHDVKIIQNVVFVSQGGYKLYKAINDFDYSVNGLTVADLGASTGGFTDCLLKNGAKKVYAVDLNDTLLDEKLKHDDRVIEIIKNAKNLVKADFNDKIDLITADLSFISEKIVLPVIYDILDEGKDAIILIKPQFETETKRKFKNGIIKDKRLIKEICKKIFDFSVSCGFSVLGLTVAPIKREKNTEFLILLKKCNEKSVDFEKVYSLLNE